MSVSPLCVVGVSRADEEQPIRGLRGHDDEIEAKDNVVTWRAGGATHKQNPSSAPVPSPPRRPGTHARAGGARRVHAEVLHAAAGGGQRHRGACCRLPLCATNDAPETARLTMNAVRQAVWCQFSCQLSSKFSLCALQSELITIFEGDGPMHTVPLPFRASRLWPACDGIIVEKQSGADDGEEHLLFSLLHPLEELRPVFFAAAAEGPDHPIKQRVLFSSTQVAAPLLVTQHEASDTMVVWVTRQRVVSAEPVGLVEDSVRCAPPTVPPGGRPGQRRVPDAPARLRCSPPILGSAQ